MPGMQPNAWTQTPKNLRKRCSVRDLNSGAGNEVVNCLVYN